MSELTNTMWLSLVWLVACSSNAAEQLEKDGDANNSAAGGELGQSAAGGDANNSAAGGAAIHSAGDDGVTSSGRGGTDGNVTPNGTVLGDLAATLGERTWVKVPPNPTLDALEIPDALLYWADSGTWDPASKMIKWVGATGSCCGDGVFRLLTYTVATNTWQISETPYSGSGHAFDGNALDSATGTLYFGQYFAETTHVWDGLAWSETPEMSSTGVTPALAWFPELGDGAGGLVFVGDEGTVRWFDRSTWTELPTVATGDYNVFAEYNPVHRVVWFGAGNGATTSNFLMDAQFNITTLADAPFSLNIGSALHGVDPVTGAHLAVNLETGAFWELDTVADTWAQITNMTGDAPTISNESPTFQVVIPEYGAILFFVHDFDRRDVYLYRHAP